MRFEGETVWLTQAQQVDLYDSSKANVIEHIKHIFEEEELDENSVVRELRTTATDGKSYNTKYYNLDMIISLGYRIKSKIATQFHSQLLKPHRPCACASFGFLVKAILFLLPVRIK